MKPFSLLILTWVLLGTTMWSADAAQTAKLEAVKAYGRGRIAYWEGRVPVYDGYPFYDLSLSLGQKKYVVRYETMTGYYPSSWKVGAELKVRLQGKHRMAVLNGVEDVPVEIVNARAQACVPAVGPPTTGHAGPQVPCE